MLDLDSDEGGTSGLQVAGFVDLLAGASLILALLGVTTLQSRTGMQEQEQADRAKLEAMTTRMVRLQTELERHRGHRIIIPNEVKGRIFFASGKADIEPDFYPVLATYVQLIKDGMRRDGYNRVEIKGHTDEVPIARDRYRDNWDLAADRALAVTRFLVSRGVPPACLAAVSHAEFAPAVVGASPEAHAKNRRIEVLLLLEDDSTKRASPDAFH